MMAEALAQATRLGHRMSQPRVYPSDPHKRTAFCRACGRFAIAYDQPPARGAQVTGAALVEPCHKQGEQP